MDYDHIIAGAVAYAPHARIPCPLCSPSRRKPNDQCMSISRADDGAVLYSCWHCTMSGVVRLSTFEREPYRNKNMSAVLASPLQKLGPIELAYLQSRGLSEATCTKASLYTTRKYFRNINSDAQCIAFPYMEKGRVIGNKYRTDSKMFTQDNGGVHVFYGLDRIKPGDIIITEGEIDSLSCMEAGIDNAISVPSGAPLLVSLGKASPAEDRRFACVWEARAVLAKATRVILAVDNDEPGQALCEELARRIGKENCWTVEYPEGCKDANDVLVKHGPAVLKQVIADAKPFPISGLFSADYYTQDIDELYAKRTGRGIDVGIEALRPLYSVMPGQLTVVTGVPSSGKSNMVDQITVNLARSVQFKTAYCSFENAPSIHIARLMEIVTGKPFFESPDGGNYMRMTEEEKTKALAWINKHFTFIDFNDSEPPTIDAILTRAKAAVQRLGIRGLVIDPYNYIRMGRSGTETDEISDMLSRVQAFNKSNDVHTWFVAHPHKMYNEDSRPGGMAVSGSASWFAKTDCGLTVHRAEGERVIVDSWKCRYRWIGSQGTANVRFNPVAGTYEDFGEVASFN